MHAREQSESKSTSLLISTWQQDWMMVLQAVPCSTQLELELEVSWTSHWEQATLHYIDNKNQIFGTADGKVHPSVFGNSLDILRAIVFKPRSHAESAERITKLLYCPKEHHKLQYNECMETKKNNAVVVNVNHPTSWHHDTQERQNLQHVRIQFTKMY